MSHLPLQIAHLASSPSSSDCSPQAQASIRAAALGCLHVPEGATLGGRVVRRRVRQMLGDEAPIDFFSGYGQATASRWCSFLQVIPTVDLPSDVAQATATAARTFSDFEGGLEERGVLR